MNKKLIICTFFIAFSCCLAAQKTLNATRIDAPVKIDGLLDEAMWSTSEIAGDFTTITPESGKKATQATRVRVLYDDEAIYFGAEMTEVSRDSIMTQLTQRDDLGNTDFFNIMLDTYGNGTDGVQFIVGATGVQFDAKKANNGSGDRDWDAVWLSEVSLHEDGWIAEIKIPYSAIRFPKQDEQTWIINFTRQITRVNEESAWNPIDIKISGIFNQSGYLRNIKDIKPPLRLFLSPYFSVYALKQQDPSLDPSSSTAYSYNGGLDLKYGINDAFTLDMTLIPDFGQVESDDRIVNLSPFEIRYSEKRPFFTEGLELFEKGDIFYTRRVGGQPVRLHKVLNSIADNEELVSADQVPQLYNATKVSGRNGKGLGIGIFNAVEGQTSVVIKNKETGSLQKETTQPLTNYNVLVLDQNLKNNSYFAFINTNVWRSGSEFYDANVSAIDFNFKDKNQSYSLSGQAGYSLQAFDNADNNTGYKYNLRFQKISGNFRYWSNYTEISPDFNPNDLGFLRRPNERSLDLSIAHNIFEPFGAFNRAEFWSDFSYSRIIEPDAFTRMNFNVGFWMQSKGFWNFNAWTNFSPPSYDYFEPRVAGRYIKTPAYYNGGFWIGSDNRKKLRVESSAFVYNVAEENRWGYEIFVSPRFRFNDHFTVNLLLEFDKQHDDSGWVAAGQDGEIYFGQRERTNFENRVNMEYNFTEKIGLTMRARHYWLKATYNSFHELGTRGELLATHYTGDHDFSESIFNIDFNFNWRFAPGSDLFFVWKNNISGRQLSNDANLNSYSYIDAIKRLTSYPESNSFSIRLVYFLDYQNVRKFLKAS